MQTSIQLDLPKYHFDLRLAPLYNSVHYNSLFLAEFFFELFMPFLPPLIPVQSPYYSQL